MFEDLIKALLTADAKLDAEYASNKAKVQEMLKSCGYTEPVAEAVETPVTEEAVASEVMEEAINGEINNQE